MRKFYRSINWFRGIAMFFVVLSHIPVYKATIPPSWVNEFNLLTTDGSFFFVFIAGFLFYHLKDRYEYKTFLINKFNNVISPYLICITPVLFLALYYNYADIAWFNAESIPNNINQNNLIYYASYLITTGGALMEPYWFIPMTSVLFIFSPLIIKSINSNYFLIITLLLLTFTLTTAEPGLVSPIQSALHWIGVYFFGAAVCKNYDYVIKYRTYILLSSLTLILCFLFLKSSAFDYINHVHLIRVPFTFLFLSILSIIEHDFINVKIKPLEVISKYSFGIYFLHPYIIQTLKRLPINYELYGFMSWILMLMATLLLSIIILSPLKKLLTYMNINSRKVFGV